LCFIYACFVFIRVHSWFPPMKRYEIIGTTADAGVIAYGENLEALFANAAAGMFALIFGGEPQSLLPDMTETFTLSAIDPEALLVAFLSELLWHFDTNLLVPTAYDLSIHAAAASNRPEPGAINQGPGQMTLKARMTFVALSGTDLSPVTDVKAVTMHNLAIKTSNGVLSVKVIFDI